MQYIINYLQLYVSSVWSVYLLSMYVWERNRESNKVCVCVVCVCVCVCLCVGEINRERQRKRERERERDRGCGKKTFMTCIRSKLIINVFTLWSIKSSFLSFSLASFKALKKYFIPYYRVSFLFECRVRILSFWPNEYTLHFSQTPLIGTFFNNHTHGCHRFPTHQWNHEPLYSNELKSKWEDVTFLSQRTSVNGGVRIKHYSTSACTSMQIDGGKESCIFFL